MRLPRELRHLEGVSALSARLASRHSVPPDPKDIAFISSCLLHGRLLWESGIHAPLETRPLLLYYGAAAFAKALIAAEHPGTRTTGHGLTFTNDPLDLASSAITRRRSGLFLSFNDCVAPLNKVYYDRDLVLATLSIPTDASVKLSDDPMRLDDLLKRSPSVAKHFKLCTGQDSLTLQLDFNQAYRSRSDTYSWRAYLDDQPFRTVGDLEFANIRVTTLAPFLTDWRLCEAHGAPDQGLTLEYENLEPVSGTRLPVEPSWFDSSQGHSVYRLPTRERVAFKRFSARSKLGIVSASATSCDAIAPLNGANLCRQSWTLATLFSLSCLVRYAPDLWTAIVHRRPLPGHPTADDALLPVIELFMEDEAETIPRFVVDRLLEP